MRGKSVWLGVVAMLLWGWMPAGMRSQAPVATGTIRGRVVDLRTGEPIAKASVSVVEAAASSAATSASATRDVTTDNDGRFVLGPVPSGNVELRVFTVGYGLLKKAVTAKAGVTVEVELRLGQDAVRDAQQITVVAGPYDPVVADAET